MKKPDRKLEIYLKHRGALVDYATPITGCRSHAEDVVQDAFLRFLPETSKTPIQPNGLAYMYRTVRNLAIDLIRRSSMENRHQNSDDVPWLNLSSVAGPDVVSEHRHDLNTVSEMISKLPDKERIAIEMHRIGGFTLKEIAQHLNISVATAHRMIRSGLANISRALNDDEPT
ncbi:sigma-70 family RNA polymerase sigma factor [Marinobacter sp.]|uniref:sigma-70 family RNA polymerase sigma factor n=1 Tax=Marinobacter sp. TaxID=50741 RepID=UPI003F955E19